MVALPLPLLLLLPPDSPPKVPLVPEVLFEPEPLRDPPEVVPFPPLAVPLLLLLLPPVAVGAPVVVV